jgi:hypothetical protein
MVVLKSYDIAFQSGREPNDPSRADFLTGSAVNSLRGYRSLIQERLPLEQLAKDAEWHHDWTSTFKQLVPDVSDTVQELHDNLKRYDLTTDDYRPGPSLRTEKEAREQLTLDLALASDVYAPHSIKPADPDTQVDDVFETMSRATEAMSIGIPEPRPVQFGFLRPESQDHYDRREERKLECPLGVRLLLSEWEIGADPREYEYRDPYDNTELPSVPARAAKKATDKTPATEQKSQPLRMPPVVAIAPTAPPTIAGTQPVRPTPATQSQGADDLYKGSQPIQGPLAAMQSSQEMLLPSTQILPGPFGGRPGPVKKKLAKKRIGGF